MQLFNLKTILVIGAGKSTTTLISYLGNLTQELNWKLIVADPQVEIAKAKISQFTHAEAIAIEVSNEKELQSEISKADIVVSMVPAFLHIYVAKACINQKKHLFTASYVSPEIKELHAEALKNNLFILMECGLDPGIDHMSALALIQKLKNKGAKIESFRSFCGGLVAPISDTNLWHYKFSWNPRNVILAGQGTAQFLQNKQLKLVPYHQLFKNTSAFTLPSGQKFEGYPNRDSISYISTYHLENEVQNFVRGTLRGENFCQAWACLIDLGLTDGVTKINIEATTWRAFLLTFVPHSSIETIETDLCKYLKINKESIVFKMLEEIGIFETIKIESQSTTPAEVLQALLEEKWKLQTGDFDQVVMVHEIEYVLENKKHAISSSLEITGNESDTAMGKTVGLPLAIAIELFINGTITEKGVQTPTKESIYLPILEKLEGNGIWFNEVGRVERI